jgi:hypothetical protein
MSKLKAFIAHMFESKWIYNEDASVRVHKETGKTEYRHCDGFGGWWADEPF